MTMIQEVQHPKAERSNLLLIPFVATVALVPLLRASVLWTDPGGADNPNRHVALHLYHLPLAVLVVLALRDASQRGLLTTRHQRPFVAVAALALLAWSVASALGHPSWRAVDFWFNLAGAGAAAYTLTALSRRRQRIALASVCAVAVLQAVLGLAQAMRDARSGVDLLEYSGDLYDFGSKTAAEGSFGHPYHLATFLMAAIAAALALWVISDGRWRSAAAVTLAVLGFVMPYTFSRAAVLGLIPLVVVGVALRRLGIRTATTILTVGLILGSVFASGGWTEKVSKSVDRERLDSGRVELAEQALETMVAHPVLGVGTGRYTIHAAETTDMLPLPPHNALLHAAGELGAPGLLLAVAVAVAFGLWVLRLGPVAIMAALTVLPFHLLDAYPHSFPKGILSSGIWIGAIILVGEADRAPDSPSLDGAVQEDITPRRPTRA